MNQEKNKSAKQKLTVYLDPMLYQEFKIYCVGKKPMTQMIEKLISNLLRSGK